MPRRRWTATWPGPALCLSVVLALGACGRKPDIKLEAAALEQVLAQSPAPTIAAPAPSAANSSSPTVDLKAYGSYALSAVRSNDYAGSVIALEAMQQIPGMSPQQRQAVQRTKAAITADLINRADRGDPKALADLKAIEKTHSQ